MKKAVFFAILTVLGSTVVAQQNFDNVTIETVAVADNVYMLKGAGGNIGVLTGPDGIIMIDDQFAPLSQKIKDAIKKLGQGDIRFLINTHIHGDHTGGNEKFKEDGVTIVAHDNVRVRMMMERVNEETGQKGPARVSDAWPVVTFSSDVKFHMNGEDIEVMHFTSGHTDGDVIIHFVQSDVYHTGDSFIRSGYPYIDLNSGGSASGFISNLEKLADMLDDDSIVIPGHGELGRKADVLLLRDQLKDIYDQVVAALKNGIKKEDLSNLPFASKYDSVLGGGFVKGKDFVLTLAESYQRENR